MRRGEMPLSVHGRQNNGAIVYFMEISLRMGRAGYWTLPGTSFNRTPAMEHPSRVGMTPNLNRNSESAAATARRVANGSMLVITGTSTANPYPRQDTVSWNMTWMPNQTARLRMTPTTAAVTADRAALRPRAPRNASM